ncbi:MAG: hypothetical protein R3E97_24400 [Candidatus Eisenbacteria bacterium]
MSAPDAVLVQPLDPDGLPSGTPTMLASNSVDQGVSQLSGGDDTGENYLVVWMGAELAVLGVCRGGPDPLGRPPEQRGRSRSRRSSGFPRVKERRALIAANEFSVTHGTARDSPAIQSAPAIRTCSQARPTMEF